MTIHDDAQVQRTLTAKFQPEAIAIPTIWARYGVTLCWVNIVNVTNVITSAPSDERLYRTNRTADNVLWPKVKRLFPRKLPTILTSTATADAS